MHKNIVRWYSCFLLIFVFNSSTCQTRPSQTDGIGKRNISFERKWWEDERKMGGALSAWGIKEKNKKYGSALMATQHAHCHTQNWPFFLDPVVINERFVSFSEGFGRTGQEEAQSVCVCIVTLEFPLSNVISMQSLLLVIIIIIPFFFSDFKKKNPARCRSNKNSCPACRHGSPFDKWVTWHYNNNVTTHAHEEGKIWRRVCVVDELSKERSGHNTACYPSCLSTLKGVRVWLSQYSIRPSVED